MQQILYCLNKIKMVALFVVASTCSNGYSKFPIFFKKYSYAFYDQELYIYAVLLDHRSRCFVHICLPVTLFSKKLLGIAS